MDLLKKVVQAIDIEFVPTLRRHALSGAATVKSQRSVFLQHAIAVDMAVREALQCVIAAFCSNAPGCVLLRRWMCWQTGAFK